MELIFRYRNRYHFSGPSGIMDRVGQLQCPQSVFSVRCQGCAVQQVCRKGVQDADMLRIFTVCLDFFFFRFALIPWIVAVEAGFPLILVQAEASYLSVFADQFSTLAVNLQPVGSRQVTCGCGEHACSAVFEFQVSRYVIFNLNMMPFPFMALCLHLDRHTAQPDQQIQLVRALIQQNAAAFSCPCGPPGSGIIILLGSVPVRHDPAHALDFA